MTISKFSIISTILVDFAKAVRGKSIAGSGGKAVNTNWSNGTGANQVNQFYDDDAGSLAAAASVNIDLASGLADDYGDTILFTGIKYVRIRNTSSIASLTVGGGSNAFVGPIGATATHSIPPGGELVWTNPTAAGWSVTPGTGDILKILNADGSNAATFRIDIAGKV